MNSAGLLVVDALLVLALVSLAWASVASADGRRSVILFMAFGLVLALAWARLQAPDIALAEAAIGAGLAGALLLVAAGDRPGRTTGSDPAAARTSTTASRTAVRWFVGAGCAALAVTLGVALTTALQGGPNDTLAQSVSTNLDASGVSNPVTAVLLNFRAYDTLLELAVLLTAVLGILSLGAARPGYRPAGPVFDGLIRWLVPVLIITAAYLLWVGAHAPGGAFQAGATLAAAGVVLRLAGSDNTGLPRADRLRILLAAGVGVFLLVGIGLLLSGRPFLGYPYDWAGTLILLIETAAMLAIAATLVLAFLGGRPEAGASRPSLSEDDTERTRC